MARVPSAKYEALPIKSLSQTHYDLSPQLARQKCPTTKLLLGVISCLCFFVSGCLVVTWYRTPTQVNHRIRISKSLRQLQPPALGPSVLTRERQLKIRDAFVKAYDSYVIYAWGHDEIQPVSHHFSDTRNGWGATIVDSMTTLFVMGLEDRLRAAINHTVHTDFTKSHVPDQPTSVFETTIRYLGSIISTYELTGANDTRLLQKAVDIATKLEVAWAGSSPIPHPWVFFDSGRAAFGFGTTVAEAGSLTLEFDRVSYWSGNDSYRRRADNTSRKIMSNPQVLPGLHSQTLHIFSGLPRGDHVGWGGNVDSFLEYAVKYWQLIGDQAVDYIKYWQEAVHSTRKHLLKWSKGIRRPYLIEFSPSEGGQKNFMTHLACFAPGNWMLGAKLLDIEDVFELGLELAETCYDSYNSTKSGLGPDKFTYDRSLVVLKGEFILRPEVLESIWYAWRLTGDPIWQERAWQIFEALEETCKVSGGYRGLRNVDQPDWGTIDGSESFVFSEFFKYLYLIFSPREYFSLDEWVFSESLLFFFF
ncbi:hypothetical protein CROQUDRAFT_38431 [Cronartium quercuum f. sp. fusiforme G11]|uniref:alpha-1,2-Mannosidase n=1 Tax=Cronartium quercuum f. sp. fusiforme G11 TaxID=708437 RepID=A0A9P6NU26_9BASI|nr:hypothetical protein CROQUDRAFT_38431 [Cronartium quercuum f. sp. fusiforme G11]